MQPLFIPYSSQIIHKVVKLLTFPGVQAAKILANFNYSASHDECPAVIP